MQGAGRIHSVDELTKGRILVKFLNRRGDPHKNRCYQNIVTMKSLLASQKEAERKHKRNQKFGLTDDSETAHDLKNTTELGTDEWVSYVSARNLQQLDESASRARMSAAAFEKVSNASRSSSKSRKSKLSHSSLSDRGSQEKPNKNSKNL